MWRAIVQIGVSANQILVSCGLTDRVRPFRGPTPSRNPIQLVDPWERNTPGDLPVPVTCQAAAGNQLFCRRMLDSVLEANSSIASD